MRVKKLIDEIKILPNCKPIETDALNEHFVQERVVMRESEIPEAIDYEVATEKGHCERLYDEEPESAKFTLKSMG